MFDYCALCNYFANIEEKDSCNYYADKAVSLSGRVDGIDDDAILSNVSHSFLKARLYSKAIDARIKIRDSYASKYGVESVQMINQLRLLADFYMQSGDKPNALKFAKQEEELSYKLRDVGTDFDQRISYAESFQYLRYIIQECEYVSTGVSYLINVLNKGQ
ncbi:MAG: hypothetical protein K2O88_08400 [Paramuribaculum sp.]|nr:hypothetical protein [Paramuribaculum sp.]